MKTPVAFIIFKRPETTIKVFEAIRQAKPPQLFVIADGAHIDNIDEIKRCENTRAIIERVDWDCEVFKNYSDNNLGCAKRVSSGLDWVFNHVEEAIILEDDCLPHPTFFPFCEQLLTRYKNDTRIASISGQNVQFGRNTTQYSYYFSRYNHCWGWASWRRAWRHFDFEMKLWREVKENNLLREILENSAATSTWSKIFDAAYEGKLDSWATRWTLACWLQRSMGILPNVNLISNIGFGVEGTHSLDTKSKYANIPAMEMIFPLKHPPYFIRNWQADKFTEETLYKPNVFMPFKAKIKKTLSKVKKYTGIY